MSNHILYSISFLILLGIFAGVQNSLQFLMLAYVVWNALSYSFYMRKRKNTLIALFIFIVGICAISLVFLKGYQAKVSVDATIAKIASSSDCRISFEGRVVGDLIVEDSKTTVHMQANSIVCKKDVLRGNFLLKVSAPHYIQHYKEGDILDITGTFRIAEAFESDSGRLFRYDMYLAKDSVFGTVSYPSIQFIETQKGFRYYIFSFKTSVMQVIQKLLPNPIDGLVIGMILGVDGALDKTLEESYRRAGLIHIVVLSGFNVTIIAEAIRRLMPFGLRTNLLLASIGIWIFAIMVGASATVIRATIMATIVLIVRGLKEDYSVIHSLWLAACIMALVNPLILVYDPSFHLSFLATCGIIYLSPFLEKRLQFLPNTFELRFTICGTMATQVYVFPYLAYAMGEISVAAFFVNVATVTFVPLIMAGGAILYVFGVLLPFMTPFIQWIIFVLVEYQLIVVEWSAAQSFATIDLPQIRTYEILIMYIFIVAGTFFLVRRNEKAL